MSRSHKYIRMGVKKFNSNLKRGITKDENMKETLKYVCKNIFKDLDKKNLKKKGME